MRMKLTSSAQASISDIVMAFDPSSTRVQKSWDKVAATDCARLALAAAQITAFAHVRRGRPASQHQSEGRCGNFSKTKITLDL
jgi:hypothetical protein